MRRTVLVVVGALLAAVVVVGAAVLAQPAGAGTPATLGDGSTVVAVRPPLQPAVVAARDAVHAERSARAERATAVVELARIDAHARWERGDRPVTPTLVAFSLLAAAVMLWAARRASE